MKTCSLRISALALLAAAAPATQAIAQAATAHDANPDPRELAMLARDVDRAESVRAVKDLQRMYAQYDQFGMGQDLAALFADNAVADFGEGTALQGKQAIAAGYRAMFGNAGLAPRQVNVHLIDEPLVNLSPDGEHAQGRWYGFFLLSDGKGAATIKGGVYENDYARENGRWKISAMRFHPQYAGPYESGWTNWKGEPIGFVPYHFTADEAGRPDLGAAPSAMPAKTTPTAAALASRIQALIDGQQVRNLQNAWGYYVDRRMWDDVVDLFDDQAAAEVSGIGVYRGKRGVRRAMERMGPQGLAHGILNDHVLFDTIVTVAPGGREAFARGIILGTIGDADNGTARWEVSVFRNRFVKQGGLWKFRELRLFPQLRSDYALGWGQSREVEPAPPAALAPDVAAPRRDADHQARVVAAFLGNNPATGTPVAIPSTASVAATGALTPQIAAGAPPRLASVAAARQKLARATAWDGAENVSTSYGVFIDDFQWPDMGAIFGLRGAKQVPFAGYYLGRENITKAVETEYGPPPTKPREGVSFHWRIQPVINVAADGRSASVRTRLFQPRTSIKPSMPGAFLGAGLWSGIYHDQMNLEDGTWRIWNLTLDEPYVESDGWKRGWSGKVEQPGKTPPPLPLIAKFPPQIPISILGEREEHFRGGPGVTIGWPGILPMWFDYLNPVSGRRPEHFQADCAPCAREPDLSLTKHGYLLPPVAPVPDPD